MVRKFRLISCNSIEIAVTGINSPFLDTLLNDHPHKVATISVPFTANAVVEFAKNVANPDREISSGVACKIASIYKLLGIDIEVENENSNNSETDQTSLLDSNLEVVNESEEPKYVIKIEIEKEQPPQSYGEVDEACSTDITSLINPSLTIEANTQFFLQKESFSRPIDTDQRQSNIDNVQNLPNFEIEETSSAAVVHPNNHQLETDDPMEVLVGDTAQSKSNSDLQADISIGETALKDIPENDIVEFRTSTTLNDEIDQSSHLETESYDEDIDVEFSFHDLEEELSPINQEVSEIVTQSCEEDIYNVVSNIIIQTSSQTPKTSKVLTSSQPVTTNQPLRLEFIKNGMSLIKDITKKRKRKRKRGQN